MSGIRNLTGRIGIARYLIGNSNGGDPILIQGPQQGKYWLLDLANFIVEGVFTGSPDWTVSGIFIVPTGQRPTAGGWGAGSIDLNNRFFKIPFQIASSTGQTNAGYCISSLYGGIVIPNTYDVCAVLNPYGGSPGTTSNVLGLIAREFDVCDPCME